MKGLLLFAAVSASTLGWLVLRSTPEVKDKSGVTSSEPVAEFAKFIESRPDIVEESKPAYAASKVVPRGDNGELPTLDQLKEAFQDANRTSDPAWINNMESLFQLAESTGDSGAVNLIQTELFRVSTESPGDIPRDTIDQWLERLKKIEAKSESPHL